MTTVADKIALIVKAGGMADLFVNGGVNDVVQTDNGPVKSIAGIADDAIDTIMDALHATSNSQVTVGMGTKTFLIGPDKGFKPGQFVTAVSGTLILTGTVANYTQNTLVMTVLSFRGTGQASSWAINFTGQPGLDAISGGGGTGDGIKPTLSIKLPWE